MLMFLVAVINQASSIFLKICTLALYKKKSEKVIMIQNTPVCPDFKVLVDECSCVPAFNIGAFGQPLIAAVSRPKIYFDFEVAAGPAVRQSRAEKTL